MIARTVKTRQSRELQDVAAKLGSKDFRVSSGGNWYLVVNSPALGCKASVQYRRRDGEFVVFWPFAEKGEFVNRQERLAVKTADEVRKLIQGLSEEERLLSKLPPVFDLRDMSVEMLINEAESAVMTQRWKAAGLIKAVGPESGTFFNLVVDPKGPDQRAYEAVKRLIPSAVVIGAKALHDDGWTTQVPRGVITIAVLKTRDGSKHPELDGFHQVERTEEWYSLAAPFIRTSFDLTYLVPEAALADAWIFGGGVWQPDPDDIDVGFVDDWQEKLMTALKAFGMDEAEASQKINLIEVYGSGQRPPYFVLK